MIGKFDKINVTSKSDSPFDFPTINATILYCAHYLFSVSLMSKCSIKCLDDLSLLIIVLSNLFIPLHFVSTKRFCSIYSKVLHEQLYRRRYHLLYFTYKWIVSILNVNVMLASEMTQCPCHIFNWCYPFHFVLGELKKRIYLL